MINQVALGPQQNPNVRFAKNKTTIYFYFTLLVVAKLLLGLTTLSTTNQWIVLHIGHSIATLIYFHLIQGSPFGDQDDIVAGNKSWYEQLIDSGYTLPLRVVCLTPVILFMIVVSYVDIRSYKFLVSLGFFLLIILPKLGILYGVRFLGFITFAGFKEFK